MIEWPSAVVLLLYGGYDFWQNRRWGYLLGGIVLLLLALGHRSQMRENIRDAGSVRAGQFGESRVAKMLSRLLPGNMYIINDLTVRFGSASAQIDHIVAGPKGLFVIETKNWSGTVRGDEKKETWEQIPARGKKTIKVGNPVSQNQHHVNVLRNWLRANGKLWDEIYSLVVVVSPHTRLEIANQSTPVLPVKTAARFIERFQAPSLRSNQEVRDMVDLLLKG